MTIVMWICELHHHAKFCADRSRRCGDMAVFDFSRWRPSAILDLKKMEILTAHTLRRSKMRHRIKCCADRSNRCGDMTIFWIFQDSGRPPSWICYTHVWIIHELYFGGLCHCAKFGLNRFSSFDNMQVLIFFIVNPENAYSRPFRECFGGKNWENRNFFVVLSL